MLDIQVNEVKGTKSINAEVKAEGSAYTIAQELHLVNKAIIDKIPRVAEIMCELIEKD